MIHSGARLRTMRACGKSRVRMTLDKSSSAWKPPEWVTRKSGIMQLGALLLAVGSALVAALIAVAGSHLNPHSGIEGFGKANIFESKGSAHRQIMSLSAANA